MTTGAISETTAALRAVVIASERYRLRIARRSLGVGATEMVALGGLAVDGPRTPTQIARRLQITTASVTELLDRLERSALVTRRPHDTDRRKVLVELTAHGRHVMGEVVQHFGDAVTAGTTGFTPSEHALLTRFLHTTAAELDRLDQARDGTPVSGRGR